MILLLLCLSACDGPRDCERIRDEVMREDCRFERASALFGADSRAFYAALEAIPSPESRDLVRLRLAIRDPGAAQGLCREVETASAQEKCRQVLGRPHLSTAPRAHDPHPPAGTPVPASPGPPR
ncbi:MAG: hypothetical protein JXB39_15400 [Deltaproteobacteria bacterium]|nr:hypothetical protein [Deltaproteobacteria bacterium]